MRQRGFYNFTNIKSTLVEIGLYNARHDEQYASLMWAYIQRREAALVA